MGKLRGYTHGGGTSRYKMTYSNEHRFYGVRTVVLRAQALGEKPLTYRGS